MEGGEALSLSLSCVEMRGLGQDPMCVNTRTLAVQILATSWVAGKHPACDWFQTPFPTYSPQNRASWLPEHKHNENNDQLSKEQKSFTSYPSQPQKLNNLPSDRNSLSNSFQPLVLFPFLEDSGVLHFRPRGKILVKEFDVNCTDSGENLNGSSNRENSVFGLFPLSPIPPRLKTVNSTPPRELGPQGPSLLPNMLV